MHILRDLSMGRITIKIFGDSYYLEYHKSNKSQAGIIRRKNEWKIPSIEKPTGKI